MVLSMANSTGVNLWCQKTSASPGLGATPYYTQPHVATPYSAAFSIYSLGLAPNLAHTFIQIIRRVVLKGALSDAKRIETPV